MTEAHFCILLIDDEPALLEVLGMLLQQRGYEVLTARSVKGALAVWNLHKGRISAVISDTWLSSTERTTDLLEAFKQAVPEMPIIVTSGYLAAVDATTHWARTRINYLPKPFDPVIMLDALETLTGKTQ
jgi:two-component system cell cycle sensor histidine kinase/response regulator CckA